jgi:hypothetical protein
MTDNATEASAILPSSTETPSGRTLVAALLLVLALAAILRWHGITTRDFFFDELWIAELSSGHGSVFYDLPLNRLLDQPNTISLDTALPLWKVPASITGAIHPPATFVMLRIWREIFGDSMLALRSFSATWSVIVVLLTFIAARLSFGNIAGLGAALLSAISLANIDQAQDVRGYTMLQAFMLLTAIALLKMRGRPSCWPGAIAVGFGTLLMMYTHYFAAGACAAIVLGAILLLRNKARRQTLGAIGMAGAIWVVTWLPQLKAQLAFVPESADIFLKDRTSSPLVSTLLRLLSSPYRALVADEKSASVTVLVGGGLVLYLLALRFSRRATGGERILPLFWFTVVAGVIGQLLLLDLVRTTQHLDFMKYVLLANPALCVLLGSFVLGPKWLMPAVASGALAVMTFLTPLPMKSELRAHVSFLKDRASPGDLIIIATDPANPHGGQAMYLYIAQGIPWPSHKVFFQVGPASPNLAASLPRGMRWFCFAFDARYRPEFWLPGTRVVEAGPGKDLGVWEVQPIAPATMPSSLPADAGRNSRRD